MGAWDSDNFGNDDAADWLSELLDGDSIEPIRQTLADLLEQPSGEYLEAPECACALAAAEVVAAAQGKPAENLPEDAFKWLEAHGREVAAMVELLEMARRAVGRIQETSELKDLFDESDSLEEWNQVQDSLKARLG